MLVLRCHTTITERDRPILDYLDVLHREIELVAQVRNQSLSVGEIHFGGGTPTIIQPGEFVALMDAIRNKLGCAPDINTAVEIDPRTLTGEMVAALGQAGVTRASRAKLRPGRPESDQPHSERRGHRRGRNAFEKAGVTRLNFDLIYGLPHQTAESCGATVEAAVAMRPDRFAVFGYAHIPAFKKHQRMIDEAALPDAHARAEQADAIARALVAVGYDRIGLNHFALPEDELSVVQMSGRLHRNFQGHTTDDCTTLIGLGASAIGKFAQGYAQNEVPPGLYANRVAAGELAITKGYHLTPEDRFRAELIERVMCDFTVDVAAIAGRNGFDPQLILEDNRKLDELRRDGLIHMAGGAIRVHKQHRFIVRSVAAAFDAYLGKEGRTFSKAA